MKPGRRVDPSSLGGVRVGGVDLANPFMTASGTSGHDIELSGHMPVHRLGAVVVKSLFTDPWPGNPAPRIHMTPSGMLNSVGLQGPGVEAWIQSSLPRCESAGVRVVASIWGRTVAEYESAARALASVGARIAAVEVNLSCPNLEGRAGIIAHDPSLSGMVIDAVVRASAVPVWAKLSPNTDRIVEVAVTVHDAGAASLTLVNTVLGMQLDPFSGQPSLGGGGGGLSGPVIHPVAVRAVHDVRTALPRVDIVGVGGIASGADALEMMRAGATAVQIGTATFLDPGAPWRIACDAARLLHRRGHSSWSEFISASH